MSRPLAIEFLACNKNPARFTEDASFQYRCANLAHALQAQGAWVGCGHVSRGLHRVVDVVVLHRPRLGWRLARQIRRWRSAGVRVLADLDDLIFLPELAPQSPGVLNGVANLSDIEALFTAHRAALLQVDGLTVSTEPLREELLAAGLAGAHCPVRVLPNAVHHRWRGWPATDLRAAAPTLGYFSGTRSHDRDFQQAAPALAAALAEHPGWRLEITGRGRFELAASPAQWVQHPRQRFDAGYCDHLRRAWVNLMPLEPTRFNRCKSALKVLEAGFWQVPTVASPLPDSERLRGPGLIEVETPQAWREAIERWADDPMAHARAAQGLRERVLAVADAGPLARAWLAHWREALAL